MHDLLDTLMELATGDDALYQEATRRAAQRGDPRYRQLCATVGEETVDEIWSAAMEAVVAVEDALFLCGLRTGLQLMALCFKI